MKSILQVVVFFWLILVVFLGKASIIAENYFNYRNYYFFTDSVFENAENNTLSISYSKDIQPIWDKYCIECHNGMETPDLTKGFSYGQVVPDLVTSYNIKQSRIYEQVESGAMPDGKSKIPGDKINTILKWLEAGYPNN